MGKLSRNKGANFEREVAKMFSVATGRKAVRVLEETREGNVGDVVVEGLPLSIQCKVGGVPPIYGAINEATEAAAKTGHIPVAIIRRNAGSKRAKADLAVLNLDDFMALIGLLVPNANTMYEAVTVADWNEARNIG